MTFNRLEIEWELRKLSKDRKLNIQHVETSVTSHFKPFKRPNANQSRVCNVFSGLHAQCDLLMVVRAKNSNYHPIYLRLYNHGYIPSAYYSD